MERRSGSHQQYHHPDGRRVTLSFHRTGDTFPIATLRRIILNRRSGLKRTFGGSDSSETPVRERKHGSAYR
ncbi:MAG: type II toxin-antitoxin system HicA family toxin [Chloroflexi bacterium]|nr:type II toxin-antitoxin system HicA family toxin [Chloroflexota bacterium]